MLRNTRENLCAIDLRSGATMSDYEDDRRLSEEATRFFSRLEYEAAYPLYLELCEKGYEQYYTVLGWMYLWGRGAPKDLEKARYWFQLRADNGDKDGQFFLGRLFEVRKNYNSAVIWFEKAARQGFMPGIYRLATMYKLGKGVEKDERRAFALYKQAAGEGHVWSQLQYAKHLMKGCEGIIRFFSGIFLLMGSIVSMVIVVSKDRLDERVRR